jgi:DNA-binding Xre family transcriptional regulator
MLQLNVLGLLESRGITNPQQYLVRQGIPYYTVSRLVTNKSKNISYENLEQLCIACKCTPDDLFVWVADEKTVANEPVALDKLKPKPKLPTAAERLKNLSAEQVKKLQEFMDELERNK